MPCLDRMKITCVLNGSTQTIVNNIKDLLYNGYGIVLFTNVGFPDSRDSTGLSYPDRNWYHTYAIIGYDDRKMEYNECVYLLANSWGDWNSGGHPSWGPIPDGSFLVTESHLKCMVSFNETPGWTGCKKQTCPPPCVAGDEVRYAACTEDTSCVPFNCQELQSAFGLAVALSTTDGFAVRAFDYKQFYNIKRTKFDDSNTLYASDVST